MGWGGVRWGVLGSAIQMTGGGSHTWLSPLLASIFSREYFFSIVTRIEYKVLSTVSAEEILTIIYYYYHLRH